MVGIEGMKMPDDCISCPFIKAEGTRFFCDRIMKFIDKNDLESKHDDCPLVDIVTCKDCKYYRVEDDVEYCTNHTIKDNKYWVREDYYCASGKRRE